MGLRSGSQGVSFVPEDWRVRFFKSSSLVYTPSEHLYVRLLLCMGAWKKAPIKQPFFINKDLPITGKPEVSCLP